MSHYLDSVFARLIIFDSPVLMELSEGHAIEDNEIEAPFGRVGTLIRNVSDDVDEEEDDDTFEKEYFIPTPDNSSAELFGGSDDEDDQEIPQPANDDESDYQPDVWHGGSRNRNARNCNDGNEVNINQNLFEGEDDNQHLFDEEEFDEVRGGIVDDAFIRLFTSRDYFVRSNTTKYGVIILQYRKGVLFFFIFFYTFKDLSNFKKKFLISYLFIFCL